MKEFQKRLWREVALCASFLNLIHSTVAYSATPEENTNLVADARTSEQEISQNSYTINFNNISIIEFIRFASKITNLNFVFEDADLQFTVTIVSEEPVSAKNVMSALAQVLRMHDLTLLEQENNVLITKNSQVNQIPTIISSDLPDSEAGNAVLVTRVFRIKNANLNTVATIIRPLTSKGALIEVSNETRQLIVTDITTNVEKIASLLTSLDAPHTPLDVETYVVKHIGPAELITLTQQILVPFAEGNPLIFVPQPETNSIFIVSTPHLLERAMNVLEDIDRPAKKTVVGQPTLSAKNILIYKAINHSASDLLAMLQNVGGELKVTPGKNSEVETAIHNAQVIIDTQSILFVADPDTITSIKDILASLDTPIIGGKEELFIYQPKHSEEQIESSLKEMANYLADTPMPDKDLIKAIRSLLWIGESNSLVFTGTAEAIASLKTILPLFDTIPSNVPSGATQVFIYKPQYVSYTQIQAALQRMAATLDPNSPADERLIKAINAMQWDANTQSFIITSDATTIARLKELLATLDNLQQASGKTAQGFFLYKLQAAQGDAVISELKTIASQIPQNTVQNQDLVTSINQIQWVKSTNSLLITGPSDAIEQIKLLINEFDAGAQNANLTALNQAAPIRPEATFIVFSPKNLKGPDLVSILKDFKVNLQNSGVSDPALFDVIDNLKWIDKTSSILVSGEKPAVSKVQELLQKFDVPGKGENLPSIEAIDNTSFLVYKLQYHQGSEIRDALKQVGHSLVKSTKVTQTSLMEAINSLQWIQVTNSLLGTGEQEILLKLKELIQNLDIPLRQVFIEVLVIETSLSNTQNFGLMWGSQVQYMNKTILSTGNFPIPPSSGSSASTPVSTFAPLLQGINATNTPKGGSTGVPFTSGFDLGVIGDIIMNKGKSFISIGSLVNALQQDTNSTVLFNPKIIAQDNQQSTVFVGQNVPYTGAAISTVGQNTQQTTGNIEYRDVGVSLTITPILGDNNIVTLDIMNDISEVVNTQNGAIVGTAQLTGLLTNHNHMETRIQVPDRHFVALSGMIQDSNSRYRTAIPCLGGLPVIGALFSESDRTASRNSIIIFLKPYIINSYEEYKQITEHEEWLYKNEASLPVLKEDFDRGLDLVKTPENE